MNKHSPLLLARAPRAGVRLISLAGLGGCALLASCAANPFASTDADYARRTALSRLREVDPARIEQYRSVRSDAATSTTPPPRAAPSRLETGSPVAVSIEEARAAALANNLDLKVALYNPTSAELRVSEEEAAFAGAFTLSARYADANVPTASQLSSSSFKDLSLTPALRLPTRTGGTLNVSAPFSRTESDNSFNTLNTSYEQDLGFSISHPLLRGAGRRVNTAALRIAGYEAEAASARTKLEVLRQLTGVERAYWQLSQAREELHVRQQQLELAQSQLDRAQRRVTAGAASDIEIVRAEEGRAQRVEAIIVAENTVLLRQRELKRIMHREGLSVDDTHTITTTTPPDPVEYTFDQHHLVALALSSRMELLELELQLAGDAVQQGFDRNRLLPLVNLTYAYKYNGLGADFGDATQQLRETRFPEWSVGIEGEVPLDNTQARARLGQTILRRVQRLATREAREETIRQEVCDACDQIATSWQRILAARQSVVASTRTLSAEQRQFDVGRSTSTNVLDASTRLAEAQLAEVRALADYQIAQLDLAFATGTLLGADKVSWEPAPAPNLDSPDNADR